MIVAVLCRKHRNRGTLSYTHERLHRHNIRALNLDKMLFVSDRQSVDNCIMDRRAFSRLCCLLKTERRLKANRNMSVEEMFICFLHIITHHMKNKVVKRQIARSDETVSRQFHAVLKAVLRLK